MTDYVKPSDFVEETTTAGVNKSLLPVRDMLLRGALAGAILGVATSLVRGASFSFRTRDEAGPRVSYFPSSN